MARLRNSIVIAFIAGIILVTPVSAETSWAEPQPLEDDWATSWFPEINADPTGTVRAVWESTRDPAEPQLSNANGSVIALSQLGPDGWSEPAAIQVKDIYNAARPIVVSDGRYVHVIARGLIDRSVTSSAIQAIAGMYYIRASTGSDLSNYHSWSEPMRLSNGASYWADLLVQPDGTLVLVYNEMVYEESDAAAVEGGVVGQTILFSRRSTDGGSTWSQPVRISTSDEVPVARSSLIMSPIDGTLLVAWDEGYDNMTGSGEPSGIMTATSTDGGVSWSDPHKLGGDDAGSMAARGTVEQSTLATSGELTMIVYRSITGNALLYRTSTDMGVTWSEEETIPDAIPRPFHTSHHFDKLALAFDAAGEAILAFVATDPNAPDGLSVVTATFDGASWSRPKVVASPEGFPEYPRLAVALGNQIQLTFFVRDQQFSEGGRYVIWTVTGKSDALATAPVAVEPAPTPTPRSQPESETSLISLRPQPQVPAPQEPVPQVVTFGDPRANLTNPIMSALRVTAIVLPIALLLIFAARRLVQLRF